MSRTNTVHLNDRELQLLREVRSTEFGDDSTPLGEAAKVVCEQYLAEERRFADTFNN